MKITCIDIGNTHTHLAESENGTIVSTHDLRTKDWEKQPELLKRYLSENGTRHVVYCSVVPNVCTILETVVHDISATAYHLTHKDVPGLPIAYPQPSEIGQDRLANAVCAQAFYGSPSIVIDMGTAVTFDIVDADGAYAGGIIAPGVAVMTNYLHEQTALLPKLSEDDLVVKGGIGKSTLDAMKLGCVIGFSGMIRALLDSVLTELNSPTEPTIIGTGGTAQFLLNNIHPRLIIDKETTVRGLAEAWRRKNLPQS